MRPTGSCCVTGANGFIGGAVMNRMQTMGRSVIGAVRYPGNAHGCISAPSLGAGGAWTPLLDGAEVVIHAAARVHVMKDEARDPLSAFREVNVDGTLNLARQAVARGVRRFVYISSIKVNGEATLPGRPFCADDIPAPVDAYAISKAEAEAGLMALAEETGLEVVIIRPPLVYGPGVKANFLGMMQWLQRGVPLPLGAADHNRRSLVALDNLVDLIVTCVDHPAAANQTFLVSDGEDLSTADLLRRLAAAMDVRARLLPVPVPVLEAAAALVGKRALMQRLCGSLQVDITKTREVLGWRLRIDVDEGLRRAAAGFNG